MLKTFTAAAALSLALVTPATAAPLSTWYGQFAWEESMGRRGETATDPGIEPFVTYTVSIGPGNGDTGCRIVGRGYQTDVAMQCTAMPELESVVIKYFKLRPSPGDRYVLGQRLFTMTRTEGGIVTRLQALSPSSDATPRVGMLFRRVR